LKEIPTGIFKASEMLEEVDFSFNQLSTLSHANTFKKNTAMTKLSLNNNMIHSKLIYTSHGWVINHNPRYSKEEYHEIGKLKRTLLE